MFETLDDADVRTAGTTYLMYRGRHRHEVAERDRADAARLDGLPPRRLRPARVLLRRHLRLAHAPAAARSSGCRACATSTPAASARYLVEHDLFDFLLLSLPDNDTHSHKNGPFAQVASLAAADQQIERLMHAAGGPDAFLEDHAVIVCSDHSQSQVERRDRPLQGVRRLRPCCRRRRACAATASRRDRGLPGLALGAGLRARPRAPRASSSRASSAPLLALEGVDLVMHLTDHPDGEAAIRGARAASCASRPRGELVDLRGERWSVEGDLDAARRSTVRDGVLRLRAPTPTRSGACGRRCAAGPRPRCCCRPRPATSSSTGAARTTSAAARTARCTPTTRSARCCGAAPGPTARTRASSGRCATSCRWCASTSAS